ncbi:hypothetical protein DRO64_07360 [Candidatus Bathyarchaeota archaeon]|nr:MAG: hypothetical protein DRO64_07360 [Candidatus Bathyarchaeota archaeon]
MVVGLAGAMVVKYTATPAMISTTTMRIAAASMVFEIASLFLFIALISFNLSLYKGCFCPCFYIGDAFWKALRVPIRGKVT